MSNRLFAFMYFIFMAAIYLIFDMAFEDVVMLMLGAILTGVGIALDRQEKIYNSK